MRLSCNFVVFYGVELNAIFTGMDTDHIRHTQSSIKANPCAKACIMCHMKGDWTQTIDEFSLVHLDFI